MPTEHYVTSIFTQRSVYLSNASYLELLNQLYKTVDENKMIPENKRKSIIRRLKNLEKDLEDYSD